MQLLFSLLIGAACGWLAGFIKQGYGFGLLGNIVIGILGSFIGAWLFSALGIAIGTGLVNHVITSVIGALAFLFVVSLFRRGS